MNVYCVVVTYCEDAEIDQVFADQDSANARVAQINAAVDELETRQSVYIDRENNAVTDSFAYHRATEEYCASYKAELGEIALRLTEIYGIKVQVHKVRGD